ncbi:DUF2207 domain-containing protein [Actinokineospora sp. NBRC 105648]|uniref:DUF2207 domain-containing protein n=1 Tax=Actinokineospora sp. NBRC 105648 TaxID=3032206 RepID=UPI00249FE29A|nr:DUF2207 domain-containing protein [Actinokineospora sp. NBRC 105648]GLZ40498.1 hypothetical protein Acsp05_41220 [Actinokineospora sp. NBRC 105648]
MLTNWGVAATTLAAGIAFAAAQPSFPSVPTGVPSIDFPVPRPGPTGSGTAPTIDPVPPTGRPARPTGGVQPVLPRSVNVQLKVERDGRLTVQEQVVVQARQTMTRVAPLRIGDRVFTVRDAHVQGNGTAEVTGDTLTIKLEGGASTVRYTVDGAVADLGDRLQFRWQVASGWDTKLVFLRASLLTPRPGQDFVCLAGAAGTEDRCDSAITDESGILRVVQSDLDSGARVDLAADLDAGMVPATARFDTSGRTNGPFALTVPGGIGLGLVTLLLLGGFVVLWSARGRDAKALVSEVAPVDLLARDGNRVTFASPDGVLPGQAGTVVDEKVDARDLSATVIDLAVRNYLWITESGGDWQLVRRNPADDSLTSYERAVYDVLLPNGAESVTLSALRSTSLDVTAVRSALYTDAVKRDWFGRRPNGIGRWGVTGAGLLVVGAVGTVLLAVGNGPALIGIAVAVGGLGLLVGARFMPARTKRGSVLVQQVRGVLVFLRETQPDAVPAADREMVFSRSLPYAVALGETEQWLSRFATLDSSADGAPGLYWYATQDEAAAGDHQRFTAQFQSFLAGLDEALAGR